jgi:ubiquinol-cytochrome c reductase cytochrome c subunit
MRLALAAVAVAVVLVLAPAACAQPPSGVARPADESGLSPLELGRQLYAGNCASCHGSDGAGVTSRPQAGAGGIRGLGPSLKRSGALAADFYLRTGYMPLGDPDEQPTRRTPLFSRREQVALVRFVASLGHGPAILVPHPETASVSEGQKLFTEHCAGCHQVVGEGGIVTGARVPPLDKASPTEIAAAVRIGPYLMPRFSQRAISDAQLDAIVRYVRYATHRPNDPGGWALDHLGPFPEGMVAWLLAGFGLVAVCMVLGKRMRS